MKFFKEIKNAVKKFFHLYILKRKYYRYGTCAKCGACCKNIYVRHKNTIIKTKEDFEYLKNNDCYPFWQTIEIIGKDDLGLIFKCKLYDEENKLCSNHKKRPSICKNYPSEEIFSMGAALKEECGYYFKPIVSFKEVLNKVSK